MRLFKTNIHLTKSELMTAAAVFFIVVASVMSNRLLRLENSRSLRAEDTTVLFINQPIGIDELVTKFEQRNIRFDEDELQWAARLLGWNRFRPGRYEIDGNYSYEVLLSRLAKGIQDPVNLTILPGISWERMILYISSQMKFDSTAMKQTVSDSAFLASQNLSKQHLLGRMLPETYLIYWDSTPEKLLRRVLNEFDRRVVKEYRDRINEMEVTVDDIVTLASIVEWEAKVDSEKTKISGLYWNRLNRGMRLQADPTVNFAIGERRRLYHRDYEYQHPYNTYLYRGLPPGPITNPSLSSIKAALFPAEHDYIYMVSAPGGDGTHVFSETYAEHRQNTREWQQWIRKQYRIKRQREAQNSNSNS